MPELERPNASTTSHAVAGPAAAEPTGSPRRLGLFDATNVVIGAIIGVGIFFTPSRIARLTDSSSLALAAWAVAGFIALCGAFAFASLGRTYRANGAQYEVLRDAYGPLPAFLFVFCNATAVQTGAIAIIALVCVDNLLVAAGASAAANFKAILAAAFIATLMLANLAGVRFGATIQNLTVVAKVCVLAWIIWLGATVQSSTPSPVAAASDASHLSPLAAILAALVPAFFSYGGWQHALWITGEVKQPERTVPRAIIGGVTIVTIVYVAAAWAYFRLLGTHGVANSTSLAADAVGSRFPELGRRFVAGAVAFSAYGVLNAQFLSGPRLISGMAADGRFFSLFARTDAKGTPRAAIVLLGAIALCLLAAAGEQAIDRLGTGVVLIDCVFFLLTAMAVLLFHARGTALASKATLAATLVFCAGETGVVIGSGLDPATRSASIIGAAWIVAAAALYAVRFRRPA